MAKLIPLEEAAEMLGVTPEKLTEMRSNNEVFGYRDGATWKFKQTEIDRVASQLGVDVNDAVGESSVDLPLPAFGAGDSGIDIDAELDDLVEVDSEDTDGPDSVLVSEEELGSSDPGASSTIIGKNLLGDPDSDLELSIQDETESSEELILDIDDEVPLLGEASDAVLVEDGPVVDDDSGLQLDSGSSGLRLDAGDDANASAGATANSDSELLLDTDSSLQLEGSSLELSGSSGNLRADSKLPPISDSEIKLSDSGSQLELGKEDASDDSPTAGSEIKLAMDSSVHSAESGLSLDSPSGLSSDFDLALESGSELKLDGGSEVKAGSGVASGSADDMILEIEDDDSLDLDGSGLSLEASDMNLVASDINLAGSDIDLDSDGSSTDVRLSGLDSDVTLNAGDSGISLSSPSDSGISLEDTPPEIAAGSGIEALELGQADVIDLGDEAADLDDATLMADDDFLLTPVEGVEADDADSGSQIIALDTEEIDEDEATILTEGFDQIEESADLVAEEEGVETVAPLGTTGVAAAPDAAYSIWNVVGLGICALILAMGGMMITDLVRNMWSWNGAYSLNSTLMDAVVGIFGG